MPWSIQRQSGKFCVVKAGTGESEGCHENRADAVSQVRALYASESDKASVNFNLGEIEEAMMHLKVALECFTPEETKKHVAAALMVLGEIKDEEPMMPMPHMPVDAEKMYQDMELILAAGKEEGYKEYPWEGPIVFENVLTGDNRVFKPGSINWDAETLPWAFRWQKGSTKGHDGAVPIGRVDHLERKLDGSIYGYGVIIPSLNEEAAEYLRLLEAGVASGVSVDGDSAEFDVQELEGGDTQIVFSKMRLRSLTAVDIPAFNEARIGLEDEDSVELGGKPSKGTDADMRLNKNKKRKQKVSWAYNLTAAAIPVKPITEWFQDPQLDGPTPITVTKDGAVFGHLALFDTCHIAFPGCVTPPKGSSYKYFHTGEVETAEGDSVDVGHLTFNTGHASMTDTARAAASHYDHTGTVAADVRAGEDEFGIWVAGALRSTLTDEDIRAFRAAPLSGDWRRIAGRLELVGALAVNVPGFPVPRARAMVASGETETLFTYQQSEEGEVFDTNAYEEGLRMAKRNQLFSQVDSALTEFHLPGQHDQSSHAKGGAHARGRVFLGKGGRKALRETRAALKEARSESGAVKELVNSGGGIKSRRLAGADLKKFTDKQLSTLHTVVQHNADAADFAKDLSIITLNPLSYGVARWREKRLNPGLDRITSELNNRGISTEGSKSVFSEDTITLQSEKKLSLVNEIAAAKKEIGSLKKPTTPLTVDQKEAVKLFFEDVILEATEDKDPELTPEIIQEVKKAIGDI